MLLLLLESRKRRAWQLAACYLPVLVVCQGRYMAWLPGWHPWLPFVRVANGTAAGYLVTVLQRGLLCQQRMALCSFK